MNGSIYLLSDPRYKKRIRYVGQTIHDPKARLRSHISNSKSSKRIRFWAISVWIRELATENLSPRLLIVESNVSTRRKLDELERKWIRKLRKAGHMLCNHTEGGGGISGWSHTDEAKCKIKAYLSSPEGKTILRNIHLGEKQSEELIRRMIAPLKGRKRPIEASIKSWETRISRGTDKHTDETRELLRLKKTGTKLSQSTIDKMKRTRSTPEYKARQSQAQKGRKASAKTKAALDASRTRRLERQASGGSYHSEETIEKMRNARLANPISAWEGKKLPDSMKANMRAAWIIRKEKYGPNGKNNNHIEV